MEILLTWFVLICVPLLLIAFPLYLLFGGLRTFALRPLQRCFDGVELREWKGPGEVELVYHTYRGMLVWYVQTEHRLIVSAADAEPLLRRLLRFNLTWGLLSYGVIVIPFLAIHEFYAQRKIVRRQAANDENRPNDRQKQD